MNKQSLFSIFCGLGIVVLAGCAPPVPDIGGIPKTVNFGRVVVGTSKSSNISLFATAPATFSVGYTAAALSGSGATNFSVAPPTLRNANLIGGSPIVVQVTCTPSALGLHIAEFTPLFSPSTIMTNFPVKIDCQGVGNVENQSGAVRLSAGRSGTGAVQFANLVAAGPSFDTSTIDVKNTGAGAIEMKAGFHVRATNPADIVVANPQRPIVTIPPATTGPVVLRFSPGPPGRHGATFKISWRNAVQPPRVPPPWNDHYFYAEGFAE